MREQLAYERAQLHHALRVGIALDSDYFDTDVARAMQPETRPAYSESTAARYCRWSGRCRGIGVNLGG